MAALIAGCGLFGPDEPDYELTITARGGHSGTHYFRVEWLPEPWAPGAAEIPEGEGVDQRHTAWHSEDWTGRRHSTGQCVTDPAPSAYPHPDTYSRSPRELDVREIHRRGGTGLVAGSVGPVLVPVSV